ncbi:hypothetical protein J2Y55_001333 [Bosea sp. BE125]|uniref:hypothetical protein n=1 Tax=Bosea sp. BE125 TaxID=2817909 RepID=UPI00285E5382|nr:hypothetical protein [Bosea sp. BE125]MDR6870333.1 hypothetical protein [Bosea sp. BE125]
MPLSSVFAGSKRFLGHVGNQAAVSIVASAVAAAFFALPQAVTTAPGLIAAKAESQGWISPVAPDGKIRERHHDAGGGEALTQSLTARGLIVPAASAMPMAVAWAQPEIGLPAPRPSPVVTAEVHARTAQVLPPVRKIAPAGEKTAPAAERSHQVAEAAPQLILPAVQVVEATSVSDGFEPVAAARPAPTILGRAVPEPVARVGDVMSSAVGTVGAAGFWTLSQASSLLPRL